MERITEQNSRHENLEHLSVSELLSRINEEDHHVAPAVKWALPQIEALATVVSERIVAGGRLFYIGAGTSGRLGIVDASECPPTFGVEHGRVIGIIAGGDGAIRKAVEFAEDDREQAWKDLSAFDINKEDVVVGIAASGSTPYVIGGLKKCKEMGIATGCITCNPGSEITKHCHFPVEVNVGPEFVTGSTRMKAGTAQKMVLNMISTTAMIKLGRIRGNKMVDMQLSNNKLIDRGVRMVMEATGMDEGRAKEMLFEYGSVRGAVDAAKSKK